LKKQKNGHTDTLQPRHNASLRRNANHHVATALIALSKNRKKGNVKGAGAIIIGPIPIVFGTDKESLKTVLRLSIVLTALLIILILVLHFLSR